MGIVFNLVKNCEEQEISWLALVTGSWLLQPMKGHMRSTCWKFKWLKCQRHLMTWLRLGQLAIDLQKAINNCFMCVSLFPFFLYLHYNSLNYPQNCKKSFRKKTLEIHWRVRDCKPTIIYTFLLVFFTIFPLPLSYLKRRFYPNTTHT